MPAETGGSRVAKTEIVTRDLFTPRSPYRRVATYGSPGVRTNSPTRCLPIVRTERSDGFATRKRNYRAITVDLRPRIHGQSEIAIGRRPVGGGGGAKPRLQRLNCTSRYSSPRIRTPSEILPDEFLRRSSRQCAQHDNIIIYMADTIGPTARGEISSTRQTRFRTRVNVFDGRDNGAVLFARFVRSDVDGRFSKSRVSRPERGGERRRARGSRTRNPPPPFGTFFKIII